MAKSKNRSRDIPVSFLVLFIVIALLALAGIALYYVITNNSDAQQAATSYTPSKDTYVLIMGGVKNNGDAFKNVLNLQKTNYNVNYTLYTKIEELKAKWENTKTPLKNALIYIYYSTGDYVINDQSNLYKIFDLIVKNFKTETLDDRTQPNIYGKQTNNSGNRVMFIADILHKTTEYVNLFSTISTVSYNTAGAPSYSSPPNTLQKQITVPNFPFTNNTQTSMTYLLSSIQSGWASANENPADVTPVVSGTTTKTSIWRFSDLLFRNKDSYLRKYDLSIKGIVGQITYFCKKYSSESSCSRSNWQACFTNNYPDGNPKLLFSTMYDIPYIRNERTILSNPKPPPPKKSTCTIL